MLGKPQQYYHVSRNRSGNRMEEFSVKGDGGKYHEMKAQYLIIEKS